MESGFLLINKPIDWTSHDVVAYLRKVTGIKKIGHAGTLDPFATGLLIVGIGREATKRLDEFKALPKTYIAAIKLGAVSSTYDRTGKIEKFASPFRGGPIRPQPEGVGSDRANNITKESIEKILQTFIGKQTQIPPMYSAKKVDGKKLYELARKGIEIKRQPHEIEIYSIKLLEINNQQPTKSEINNLKSEIKCSAGTYIRTLAHDIGQALGTGAYCEELERTQIGDYKVEDAIEPKQITKENLLDRLLPVSKLA